LEKIVENDGLGTRRLRQVGMVVRNVERTARALAELLGLEPPQAHLTGPLAETNTRYRGRPTDARAKLAFFDLGGVSLELIEPVGGPSTWREFLDRHGEGVHHIAFRVEDMDRRIEFLSSKGIEPVQRGDYPGGSYCYLDSADQLGVILELLASRPA
jgi:methylmalonyl-CoA/ethylmalonyl-CoA epimerase